MIATDDLVSVTVEGRPVGAWRRDASEVLGEVPAVAFVPRRDWANPFGVKVPRSGLVMVVGVLDPALTFGLLDPPAVSRESLGMPRVVESVADFGRPRDVAKFVFRLRKAGYR